jgi:hypothetical protein
VAEVDRTGHHLGVVARPQGDGRKGAGGAHLLVPRDLDVVTSDRRLVAYVERCTTRPAFRRALAAQMRDFRDAA